MDGLDGAFLLLPTAIRSSEFPTLRGRLHYRATEAMTEPKQTTVTPASTKKFDWSVALTADGRPAVSSFNRPLKSAGFQPTSASDVCLCCKPGRRDLYRAKLVRSPIRVYLGHDRETEKSNYKYLAHRCKTAVTLAYEKNLTDYEGAARNVGRGLVEKSGRHCALCRYCLVLSPHN